MDPNNISVKLIAIKPKLLFLIVTSAALLINAKAEKLTRHLFFRRNTPYRSYLFRLCGQ